MSRQWRCAVIGTGMIGEWHLRAIAKISGCEVAAVCDAQEANARRAVEKIGVSIPVYTSAAELLKSEKPDAVHICTPSGAHRELAIEAMRHGACVVVEKPMEIRAERIDEMDAAAKKNGVRLAGIFQNRWSPTNQAIKRAMVEGRFGKVAWAGAFTPWYRTNEYYEAGGWRGTWKMDGGGAVMNQGIHQVDLIQWIMGPVKTVTAFASSRIHAKIEVEDTLTCAMQFASGAYGTFVSTTAMYPGGPTRLEIGGEDGTAISEGGLKRFDFRAARAEDGELLNQLDPGRSSGTGGGANPADVPLEMHIQNIASIYGAWNRGEEAETNGPEARKSVVIIEAMYESARKNGEPVEVK
jgi:UDP-N-acetyl-2-amino-2-deoxyglucuronate dehydrogenase